MTTFSADTQILLFNSEGKFTSGLHILVNR